MQKATIACNEDALRELLTQLETKMESILMDVQIMKVSLSKGTPSCPNSPLAQSYPHPPPPSINESTLVPMKAVSKSRFWTFWKK